MVFNTPWDSLQIAKHKINNPLGRMTALLFLTLSEAVDHFWLIATWSQSNLVFWQLWLPQRRHFSHANSWETHDAVDALKWPFFGRKSCRFGPLKLRFPSSLRPAVELYVILVLVSGLLSCQWTICQCSISAAIQTTAWFGHPSFDLRELCLAGEAWKLQTLQFWRYVRIIPDDFFLTKFLANFWVCNELLDLCFVISETKTFRQGKVVISKSASFFWKKVLFWVCIFSSFYSWQWPQKELKSNFWYCRCLKSTF